ncbi:hypothetical protein EI94DRAFT_1708677 [Lactarius quietus]|nr:hypothetical protein EI94DRAFT_1708677 [Lactarius quietus]
MPGENDVAAVGFSAQCVALALQSCARALYADIISPWQGGMIAAVLPALHLRRASRSHTAHTDRPVCLPSRPLLSVLLLSASWPMRRATSTTPLVSYASESSGVRILATRDDGHETRGGGGWRIVEDATGSKLAVIFLRWELSNTV